MCSLQVVIYIPNCMFGEVRNMAAHITIFVYFHLNILWGVLPVFTHERTYMFICPRLILCAVCVLWASLSPKFVVYVGVSRQCWRCSETGMCNGWWRAFSHFSAWVFLSVLHSRSADWQCVLVVLHRTWYLAWWPSGTWGETGRVVYTQGQICGLFFMYLARELLRHYWCISDARLSDVGSCAHALEPTDHLV